MTESDYLTVQAPAPDWEVFGMEVDPEVA